MDDVEFVRFLKERLSPEPYPEVIDGWGDDSALLVRRSFLGARYALAVVRWQQEGEAASQLKSLRRKVDALLDAWWLRKVGMTGLFYGRLGSWEAAARQLSPDRHGLRSTILQGIVFVDPQTGQSHVSRSAWGPIKFGNWQGQLTRLQAVLKELETIRPQVHAET